MLDSYLGLLAMVAHWGLRLAYNTCEWFKKYNIFSGGGREQEILTRPSPLALVITALELSVNMDSIHII